MKRKISFIDFGNLLRVISALGVVILAFVWYNSVKDHALGTVIEVLGKELTARMVIPFGLYGIAEAIVVWGQRSKKAHSNFILSLGRIMRIAPLLAPPIAHLTGYNFFLSILIPAGLCCTGWGFEYMGKIVKNIPRIRGGWNEDF